MTMPVKPPVLRGANFVFARFDHLAEKGVTIEDVLNPDYWRHNIPQLHVNAMISVIAEDGSFDCDLRVIEIGPAESPNKHWAKVRPLRVWRTEAAEAVEDTTDDDAPDYRISFSRAPDELWRVLLARDGSIVAKGFRTKADALKARENLRAQRKAAA